MGIFDFNVKALETEARKEVAEEHRDAARARLKASFRAIALAEKTLANLRAEHAAILRDIGSE